MFLRITKGQASQPNSLQDIGMTSDTNPLVSLIEFTYKEHNEIYGEKQPAEYVYQVKKGAVQTYKILADGRRQIGAFHLVGDFLVWKMAARTASRRKRSSKPRFG